MEDKVEEINTEEVSLIETEGTKRRSGSFIFEGLSFDENIFNDNFRSTKLPMTLEIVLHTCTSILMNQN